VGFGDVTASVQYIIIKKDEKKIYLNRKTAEMKICSFTVI